MDGRPEFDDPPVFEMALGVQFRPLFGLRGIALGPLRERWRDLYPRIEEQPPLAPAIEGPITPGVGLVLGFGPGAPVRHWFLSPDGSERVQLQNDRLIVNWRQVNGAGAYPRYERMRRLFQQRLSALADRPNASGLTLRPLPAAVAEYAAAAAGNATPLTDIVGPLNTLASPGWLALSSFDDVTVTTGSMFAVFARGAPATSPR